MSTIFIQPRNFVLKTNSSFRFDFDVVSGEERIQSITAGGAVDDYNYLFVINPNGKSREFTFNFLPLKKAIYATSVLNMVIRIMDIDGGVFEFAFSKNYAVESGLPSIFNPRVSQRFDGSKQIDIMYDYDSPNEIDPAYVSFQISKDWGKTWINILTSAYGDVGLGVVTGPNRKITFNYDTTLQITEPTPISAKITITNIDGVQAFGNGLTGTLMLYPSELSEPILSIESGEEKPRFAKQNGNLYKNNSIDFDPIDMSSSSSESSISELSESSDSSSDLSESSNSSSTYNSYFVATGFTPDSYNGTYYGHDTHEDSVYGWIGGMRYGDGSQEFITIFCAAALSSSTSIMINWGTSTSFRQTQPGGTLPDSYPWTSVYPDHIPGVFTS